MNVSNAERVEIIVYQLKKVAYKWYDEWEMFRGEDAQLNVWEVFSRAFLDHLFTQS